MDNGTQRLLACILFGLAALGSFTTSYLHVVSYFTPVMPGVWPEGAYVAGLALDVLAIASGVGLILTTAGTPGRAWLHVGLWAPVALSVWANWRYAAEHVGAGAWAFDPVVSACLPVLLVIATHGLAAVLRAIPADTPAIERQSDRRETLLSTMPVGPPKVAPPSPRRPRPTAPTGATDPRLAEVERILLAGALPAGYETGAALASDIGRDPAWVSRRLNAGRAAASANGHSNAAGGG